MTDSGSSAAGVEPDDRAGAGGPADAGTAVWRRATSTAYVESADESDQRVVVLDLDHLELPPYVFEGSAAQIWGCIDGDRTVAEIVHDLAEAFEVPDDVVGPDVREFVDRLRDLGLIVADDVS
ncbi:MAG TPA: PqqD family protein [Nocardioides sp.]|uniref:PqqD family protein n=1 Tax=Nocardioides sp. TaxID=35761 RepID=UPI002F3EC169